MFYTWGEEEIVLVVLASTFIDFSCGLLIEKGKKNLGLAISLVTNLSFLFFFKYFNFAFDNFAYITSKLGLGSSTVSDLPNIALPIGISFYTFQTLSYTIDVYRGNVKANRNFVDFAAYVTMFPQLVAGPIVRYADINKQLRNKSISFDNFSFGIQRFIIGLAKKVLIANTFAEIADSVFSQNINSLSTEYAWVGILAYSFQIYFDFSGYSDMAIGLGRMFGFTFLENFNYPYISKSIKEFWRRWHISLSSWFRDYIYISLGGNRLSNLRTYLNLFIVFFVTGLWHGSSWNFVIWGLFHGIFIVIERLGFDKVLKKLWIPFQHLYTLLVVVIGWVFFRADDIYQAKAILKKMFIYSSGDEYLVSYLNYFHLNLHTLFFLFTAIIFSMPVFDSFYKKIVDFKLFWVYSIILIVLVVGSMFYIGAESYNPFIYFRF
ncbi:MAG: MBOAT family O-acyltransferase [Chitinophagales bacterium]